MPSWETAQSEDLLGKWAMNLMLINVSTRKFGRAVRLPEGDVPAPKGAGVSKSAVSRRFVALSAERMTEWMAADLSKLDLLIIQIDGIHIEEDLILLAAVGIDGDGGKHPLGVIEGATENTAVDEKFIANGSCPLLRVGGAAFADRAGRGMLRRPPPQEPPMPPRIGYLLPTREQVMEGRPEVGYRAILGCAQAGGRITRLKVVRGQMYCRVSSAPGPRQRAV